MTATPLRRPAALVLALLLPLLPQSALSEYLSLCPGPSDAFWPQLRSLEPGVIEVESDFVEAIRDRSVHARGDVRLFTDGRRVDSDWIDYDLNERMVETRGRTRVFDGDLLVEAGEGRYWLDHEQGDFSDIEYWLRSRRARGSAAHAEQEGPGRIQLTSGSYTTCPEDDDSWWLSAGSMHLDQDSGRGHARNVTLRFRNVPVFYTPYINFPIDDRRQSGLLTPHAGYSTNSGLDVAAPWYWNIAPQYDATLTPRIQSRRGLMLETEWRYLRPWGSGIVDLAFLPNDRVAGDDRHLFRWRQQARLRPDLFLGIDATDVSDQKYFQDFGTDLFSSSTAVVERRVDLIYDQPAWRLTGRVQGFQSLDPSLAVADRPYQRLPQLLLQAGHSLDSGLYWSLRSELVQFDRSDSVTGTRFDLEPEVGFRHDGGGYFIEPRVSFRQTDYRLQGADPGADRSPSRTLPAVAVDGGLIFERTLDDGSLQTLEPRVFYGYVPFRNQDDLPLFDTGERDFSFDSLFTTRRFIGADRVGDTHQITTALTTRIIDPSTGTERLSLSGGQITYLDDRRVGLRPDAPPRRENRSELAAEAQALLGRNWHGRGSILFDTDRNRARLATVALSYRPDQRALVNLGYRLREGQIEQTDVSGYWPLTNRIQAIGRWNYSLREDRDLELLAGLEYRSCCYGLRVALRRYLTDFDGGYNNAIYFQLTLDGLTRFDTGLDNLLREGISGYGTFENH
ncbi:LPS-assembly protein LptD [Thioalkalivibrio paradoxus]|uniref:LPS-assembly protein LptD n=1 Tax=Thioalkalivibrio paradoxus ARh 1 TaxID=713585 RepID=W0DH15_9GAMM|nr:LPS assembly protein LptD [Thioalkalivibrio paradoxus]AHE97929.1 organic solvent tolerance protein [Thioalkalivibrio paradoxus ARh 1]